MKIGLLMPNAAISPTGGIKVQGKMWKQGIEYWGHECVLIDFWIHNDWGTFDAIVILGFGGFLRTFAKYFRGLSKKFVLAPILDPNIGKWQYRLLCKYYGSQKIRLSNVFHDLYISSQYFDLFLVRSQFEADYVNYCLDVPYDKIKIVPLSVRTPFAESMPQKEHFVLHMSRLASPNKNVERLVEAAIKYQYPLKLGGILNGEGEKAWLHNLIQGHNNIEYIGLLSEKELIQWYARAKVFALPSLVEGVGMVALEAAGQGAEIVLTKNGAPKDYYNGRAYLVNPKSVDSIGRACVEALDNGNRQPELLQYIKEHYSLEACSLQLIESLK